MLVKKAPICGAFFLSRSLSISHCQSRRPRIPLVVWYIAYKDADQVALSIQTEQRALGGEVANIILTVAAIADHKVDVCRPSYQRELPHNDFDDRCGPRATHAGVLRHLYRNFV